MRPYARVLIDEAHHTFSTGTEAVKFYREVLSPDFTLMITATPDDKDAENFRISSGIAVMHRFTVSRLDAVAAKLIKGGIKSVAYLAGDQHRDLHHAVEAAARFREKPADEGERVAHLLGRRVAAMDAARGVVRGGVARHPHHAARLDHAAERPRIARFGLVLELHRCLPGPAALYPAQPEGMSRDPPRYPAVPAAGRPRRIRRR